MTCEASSNAESVVAELMEDLERERADVSIKNVALVT